MEALKAAGYTCVAVLWEARGVASPQSTNCYFSLQGHVADTAQANCVYMVTHSAQAWNKANVQAAAAEYFGVDAAALTDEQYTEYMKSEFPSRADGEQHSYADYPDAFWVNNAETDSGLSSYSKSEYDADGYTGGSAGVSHGDSCLVVPYVTQITKKPMQTTSSGAEKLSYDMDANQRVADYALHLSVLRTAGESNTEGAQIITDLYLEDTLPQGLTYIPGSAYWGGTRKQPDSLSHRRAAYRPPGWERRFSYIQQTGHQQKASRERFRAALPWSQRLRKTAMAPPRCTGFWKM